MNNDSAVLKPGENIKPIITINECKNLFFKHYGLKCYHIEELNGYDDKNFKITVDVDINDNKHIENICAVGYILKIMNSLDSQKECFVEGQNSVLLFLGKKGVKCPTPVKNKNGKYYSLETLCSGEHILRLYEYIPGHVLFGIPYFSADLFYEVGKNIATVDVILQDFHHPAYTKHKTLWMLDSVPELHKFLFAIEDEERKLVITDIISRFEFEILTNLNQFERGLIHGDCNEQNILVEQHSDGSYHYSALLDFGDTSYGCYLFELSITMLYMMLLDNDVDVDHQVLMGYNSIRRVTELELNNLLLCISARLCQSLVLGAYTSRLYPANSSYLLTTAKKGWDLLTILNNDNGNLTKTWKKILNR